MCNRLESINVLFLLAALCGVGGTIVLGVLLCFCPWVFSSIGCFLAFEVFKDKDISLMDITTKFVFPLCAGLAAFGVATFGLWLTCRRTEAMLQQAAIQQAQIDLAKNQVLQLQKQTTINAFKDAIDQLGHTEQTVRLGAIYALHAIAKNEEKYRLVVANILCGDVREVTCASTYKQKVLDGNAENKLGAMVIADETVQTVINLLFSTKGGEKEVYDEYRAKKKDWVCLSGAFLHGIWLFDADLSNVDLWRADLRAVNLYGTNFSGADLGHADLRAAKLSQTTFSQETNLKRTKLQGVQSKENEYPYAYILGAMKNKQALQADFSEVVIAGEYYNESCKKDWFIKQICKKNVTSKEATAACGPLEYVALQELASNLNLQ